jgi:hypothetical protein
VIIFLDEAALVWLGSTQNHCNVKRKLVSAFNLIWVVQSLGAKIFRFKSFSIGGTSTLFLPVRGAYRDRHGRWAGMRWMQATPLTKAPAADGEVVWS